MTWTDLQTDLAQENYVASDDLSVALHLALSLGRPLLLEGAAAWAKPKSPGRWPPTATQN